MRKWLLVGVLGSLAAVCCPAQESASQPTSRLAPTSQERFNDLLTLIDGQNPPEVRRKIDRELLLQRWPDTTPRLTTLLNGPNSAAKIAISSALTELPEFLEPAYIDPLFGMLTDPDAAVRQASAGALAAYHDNGVTPRLRQLAGDYDQPRTVRLAALSALGQMTEREAVEALAALLHDPDPLIAQAALTALSQATAMDFNDDLAAAEKWWEESSTLSREAWQQRQIERLVRKDRETRRRLDALEARLNKALEASFIRASDPERLTLLAGYLADAGTSIRLLGLRLAQLHLAEGKSLPQELQDRIRELMGGPEAREQAAAVQTVASLRDPRDAGRFLEMLASARSHDVRLALLNGLGYVGDETAVPALLSSIAGADEVSITEAVAALGRLAERGVLHEDSRDGVVTALLSAFAKTLPSQATLRERLLWAMANVGDVRFGPVFVAALDAQDAVAVRLAAVRGIGALKNPQLADALAAAVSDPDPGVRKLAISTLATLGSSGSDKQLQALWERVVSPQETEETVRQAAWRGVIDILAKGSAEDVERWLARLPNTSSQDAQRRVELLEQLAKIVAATEPVDNARLGLVRARLAAQRARLDEPSEAVATYVAALSDLQAAKSDATQRVALELLRYALANGRYDESVAEALATVNPGPQRQALWQAAKAEVESRLTPASVDQVSAMLAALERYPPEEWPAEARVELKDLRERAVRLKQTATEPATTVPAATAPAATAPAS